MHYELRFSVLIYTLTSIVCIALLLARRNLAFFGKAELGGPLTPRVLSSLLLLFMWLIYVLLSSLKSYGYF
jgi:solute carrier family 8 (sodium/calcium exchanger)